MADEVACANGGGGVRMTCPRCSSRMAHFGYFDWACGTCGHSSTGDLPAEAHDERGESESHE
jgi:tRNA(Ile2) C34 agmatinyltransferase TiaS